MVNQAAARDVILKTEIPNLDLSFLPISTWWAPRSK
jgi:hypothetical protein